MSSFTSPLLSNQVDKHSKPYTQENSLLLYGLRDKVSNTNESNDSEEDLGIPNHLSYDNANTNNENSDSNYISWNIISYYLPCFIWIPNYTTKKLLQDFISGLTLASFQIPLSLSYATSLAHVESLSGLYSLAIAPFVYGVFGSIPQIIVGPESAISLVVGQNIEEISIHNPDISLISLTAIIAFLSGLFLLIGGLFRLGYLGNILSRALLRGFISSVGFVMIVNSLVGELKLNKILKDAPEHYHTPFEKILFLIKYAPAHYHHATTCLSLATFFILMFFRVLKKKITKRHKWIIFVPEILLVVCIVTFLSIKFRFNKDFGISVIGEVNTNGFDSYQNPLSNENRALLSSLTSVSFIIAVLGFFESITASKGLANLASVRISANRELIALGCINLVGSSFGMLPAFGGYGRSKINSLSGGQTVMSGVFMGFVSLLTIKFLLPVIHYIPSCVLSVITTVIGITVLEEAPSDIAFHINCKGYNELFVFCLTFLTTLFYSVEMGLSVGCIYSVITIIKHSAKSRIQIIAQMEGIDHFTNIDEYTSLINTPHLIDLPELKKFKGSLVVKIPEPLTFTNTEDLKERLERLERFGSLKAHPGSNHTNGDKIENVVFDLNGMTYMDSSAAQILNEIVTAYNNRCVNVFLVNVPFIKDVREKLESSGTSALVQKNRNITNNCVSQNYELNVFSSSYFPSVNEALFEIENCKLDKPIKRKMLRSESNISATLLNSNLV